jgi:predicted nucleic acid-binding protein
MAVAAGGIEVADISVWYRIAKPALAWFQTAVVAGEVGVCDVVMMELLYSARDSADYENTERNLLACPFYPVEPADWAEARRVWRALARSGPGPLHRQVGHQDLLIAAVAARNGLTVVHYDADYETIARITGQPVRWAAPRGTAD